MLLEENHAVFQAEALRGICVFEVDPAHRKAYEMKILARTADFRPFLDLFHKEVLEALSAHDQQVFDPGTAGAD